jgi:hypothetical protein
MRRLSIAAIPLLLFVGTHSQCASAEGDARLPQWCRIVLDVDEAGNASLAVTRLDDAAGVTLAGQRCHRRQAENGQTVCSYVFSDPRALEHLSSRLLPPINVEVRKDLRALLLQPVAIDGKKPVAFLYVPYWITLPCRIACVVAVADDGDGRAVAQIGLVPRHLQDTTDEPIQFRINISTQDQFRQSATAWLLPVYKAAGQELLRQENIRLSEPAGPVRFKLPLPVDDPQKSYLVSICAIESLGIDLGSLELTTRPLPYLGFSLKQVGDVSIFVGANDRSPLKEAGLKAGDQILAINGEDVRTPAEVLDLLASCAGRDEAEVTIGRRGETINRTVSGLRINQPPEIAGGSDGHVAAAEAPQVTTRPAERVFSPGVYFTKKRLGDAPPVRNVDAAELQKYRLELQARGDQSEMNQILACARRACVEHDCKNTALESLAQAYAGGLTTFEFKGEDYDFAKEIAKHGVEWVLWLMVDAGIPLQTIHKYMQGFPAPACIPVPEDLPAAKELLQQVGKKGSALGGDGERFRGSEPFYESLKTITLKDAKSAMLLPRFAVRRDESLSFKSLAQITPECARILSAHKHSLEFPALTELSVESAAALAAHTGGFSRTGVAWDDALLVGVQDLQPVVAKELAKKRGLLQIGTRDRPLADISLDCAKALSSFRGRRLVLCATRVANDAQDALARCASIVDFHLGPAVLSSQALARKLVEGREDIALSCQQLSPEGAKALVDAAKGRDLVFSEAFKCDESVARVLAGYRGEITFTHLVAATPLVSKLLETPVENEPVQGLLDMLGSTEEEIAKLFGAVRARDQRGEHERMLLDDAREDCNLIAVMRNKKCVAVLVQILDQDGKPLVVRDGMENAIQEKLSKWTATAAWKLERLELRPLQEAFIFLWTHPELEVMASVGRHDPTELFIALKGEKF